FRTQEELKGRRIWRRPGWVPLSEDEDQDEDRREQLRDPPNGRRPRVSRCRVGPEKQGQGHEESADSNQDRRGHDNRCRASPTAGPHTRPRFSYEITWSAGGGLPASTVRLTSTRIAPIIRNNRPAAIIAATSIFFRSIIIGALIIGGGGCIQSQPLQGEVMS